MAMHDILIGAVIIAVLLTQFAVFRTVLRKIQLFKDVIPEDGNFKIIKALVPEDQIGFLSVKGIFENENHYTETKNESDENLSLTNCLDIQENQLDDRDEESIEYETEHPETEIWVTKENEEKKIQYRFLASYEASGWKRIDY